MPIAPTIEETAPHRVLVVDDEADIRTVVRHSLERAGFAVSTASSAAEALAWVEREGLPHLAIVDIRMPGMSGLELCRELLKVSDLPIIMLSAVDEGAVIVNTIENVAEDYLTKPFNPDELAARARRVLRRLGDFAFAAGPQIDIDDHLALRLPHREAVVDGLPVPLTPTESKILHILLRNSPRTVRSDYLLQRAWPLEEVYQDTLRVHIHRLRQKIEPDPASPRYLLTHRGLGYSFQRPG